MQLITFQEATINPRVKITLKTNASRDSPGENYFNPIFGKIQFLYPLKMSVRKPKAF